MNSFVNGAEPVNLHQILEEI